MPIVRLRILGESVLRVRDRCIAPDAPQLFALLLYVCQADGRAVHKTELLELLFPSVIDSGRAAHNLRQLVYRLRSMGVPIESERERLRLSEGAVASNLDDFASLSRHERLQVSASGLSILPCYEPTISPQLVDWVETLRSTAAARIRAVLRDDLRVFQREGDWESVVVVGRKLQELNVLGEELASALAEALSMLGRKHDALDALDAFLVDCEPSSVPTLRQLRGRISRAKEHVRPLESAFHGRGDVMRALRRQWSDAIEQETQVTIVVGPPGIGKSRLAREFSAFAVLNDGHCLAYRCDAADNARPHSLFKHLLPNLRSLRGSLGADPALQHHLDRLSANSPVSPPMDPASLEATRSDLQYALVDLMQAVSTEKTQLLVIDDAQFLDSASRSVVEALYKDNRDISLMVLCCYRGNDGDRLSVGSVGAQVHHLAPLTDEESLAVLRDLLPQRKADPIFLADSVARAGGNPYYLHAIAQSGTEGGSSLAVPFDVCAFASAAYFGLEPDARTLFESCLLLGRFANLKRVREIASIDGPPLLSALRTLEDHGLLSFSNGELRCAHALLEEAARLLIPSAVQAALSERIAKCLERECASQGYAAPMASAAAASWIAAGDITAASRLLQHCAAHAAALGEPRLAANTLLLIPRSRLEASERIALIGTIIEYAEAAGSHDLVCCALRDLLSARRELPSASEELREIEFRIIEAELRLGINPTDSIAPLTALVADATAPVPIRVRAGTRLLIAADVTLDAKLAGFTMQHLRPLLHSLLSGDPLRLRAEIIYETVFGDAKRAVAIASALIAAHPLPALSQASVSARRNAAFALSRIGLHEHADPVLLEDYRFMFAHRVTSEAAYRALLLADNFLSKGDLTGAALWLKEASTLVRDEPRTQPLQAGYYFAAATLALHERNLAEAERLIEEARIRYPAIGYRYRAFALSLRLKASVLKGIDVSSDHDLAELKELFQFGETLGAQDTVVEALWLAHHVQDAESASALLSAYLYDSRRELGEPEASLRLTTAHDRAWCDYESWCEANRK